MHTVVETLLFQRQWPLYWTEEERGAFAAYIAEHPTAGDVVPGSGGIRKVRWGRSGSGKSGGVRVIYFTRNAEGEVVLLTLYAKSKTDNLTPKEKKEKKTAPEPHKPETKPSNDSYQYSSKSDYSYLPHMEIAAGLATVVSLLAFIGREFFKEKKEESVAKPTVKKTPLTAKKL